jgi:6,7-dimethyl-8-ribityllumazine synthase
MIEYRGEMRGDGRRFGIVVSRFNDLITRPLLAGAEDCLLRHGVAEDAIEAVWVPGAWEIPVALRALAETGRFDALIALGAVIRGATPHFEYVSSGMTSGIAAVATESGIPVSFGVLTTDTIEHAIERAGTKAGNKGWDAALAALETVSVLARLADGGSGERA